MKLVRFNKNGGIYYGVLEGSRIKSIVGDVFASIAADGPEYAVSEVKLLAPAVPPNVIAIGLNYSSHAGESGAAAPERPVIFLKATTSVTSDGADILLPRIAPDEVDYEAELCVVIGKTAKDVPESEALDYVLGYMCGNDVSARDCQQRLDTQWARGKSFDTFCPVGPHIETGIKDPDNLDIYSKVNGVVMQSSNTRNMIFSTRRLISYCSRNMTLLPGTLIMTGTPEGVGFARKPPVFLRDGDTVEIGIQGIGAIVNKVKKAM